MGRKELLWTGARVSLLRPRSIFNKTIVQHHHQSKHHFNTQSGGSTGSSQQRVFKRWFSSTLSFSKKKVGSIPYFSVVLGFAASGCLGTGLLVVFADGSPSPPSISNTGGLFINLIYWIKIRSIFQSFFMLFI